MKKKNSRKPKVLAVIGARSGSKGIPDKNIKPLLGKPLFLWVAEAAKKARSVSRLVLSTDSPAYAALANGTEYGLTAAIHTKSIHRIEVAEKRLVCGVLSVNGPTYGSEPHLPFGGVKNSGNGWREAGTEALDVYSEWKTVYIKHNPQLLEDRA